VVAVGYDFNEDTSGGFLHRIRKLTKEYGALFVLDEVLTGFRLAPGGAQQYYGVDADLAGYAKAIANGYPLSAYCGKRECMEMLNTFKITTTYAGETLSIAAAIATLDCMVREKVHEHIWAMGRRLMDGFNRIAAELGVAGHAADSPRLHGSGSSTRTRRIPPGWNTSGTASFTGRGYLSTPAGSSPIRTAPRTSMRRSRKPAGHSVALSTPNRRSG